MMFFRSWLPLIFLILGRHFPVASVPLPTYSTKEGDSKRENITPLDTHQEWPADRLLKASIPANRTTTVKTNDANRGSGRTNHSSDTQQRRNVPAAAAAAAAANCAALLQRHQLPHNAKGTAAAQRLKHASHIFSPRLQPEGKMSFNLKQAQEALRGVRVYWWGDSTLR